MEEEKNQDLSALNEELLAPVPEPPGTTPPKRNTKAALIARILEVRAQGGLGVPQHFGWSTTRSPWPRSTG